MSSSKKEKCECIYCGRKFRSKVKKIICNICAKKHERRRN